MNERPPLKKELSSKVTGYIVTAFGLVVGLAWNDAIKELIKYLFPLDTNTILAKFIYAVILTIMVVIGIRILNRFTERD